MSHTLCPTFVSEWTLCGHHVYSTSILNFILKTDVHVCISFYCSMPACMNTQHFIFLNTRLAKDHNVSEWTCLDGQFLILEQFVELPVIYDIEVLLNSQSCCPIYMKNYRHAKHIFVCIRYRAVCRSGHFRRPNVG